VSEQARSERALAVVADLYPLDQLDELDELRQAFAPLPLLRSLLER
jgi:hypothetical protein